MQYSVIMFAASVVYFIVQVLRSDPAVGATFGLRAYQFGVLTVLHVAGHLLSIKALESQWMTVGRCVVEWVVCCPYQPGSVFLLTRLVPQLLGV